MDKDDQEQLICLNCSHDGIAGATIENVIIDGMHIIQGERMRKAAIASVALTAMLALSAGTSFAQGNVAKGKGIFDKNCASCHGAGGKGDGVAAASLNPKPKDLTDKTYMAGLKDEQLVDVIKKGGGAVGKSPLMPPFGAALKDQDLQDVVAFIRSLVK